MKKTNLKAYEFQKREHKENAHYVKIEGTIYYVHDVFDSQAKETAEDKLRYLMEQEMQKSFVKHWTCRIGCGILVDSTIGLA